MPVLRPTDSLSEALGVMQAANLSHLLVNASYARWLGRSCLVRDDRDKPLFSIGVSQNISDRKRGEAERKQKEAERQAADQALQASHRRINNILESVTDAFFALDQQWQFTYLNQRAEQFLRRSRHRVLGQNLWREFPEILATAMAEQLRQAMAERVSPTFEKHMAQSDSWCEFHVYPTPEGLAVYFQDITGRKRAYEQIEHQIRREQALNRVVQAIRRSPQDLTLEGWCIFL